LFSKSDVIAFLGISYFMGSLSCDVVLISGLSVNDKLLLSTLLLQYYNRIIYFTIVGYWSCPSSSIPVVL